MLGVLICILEQADTDTPVAALRPYLSPLTDDQVDVLIALLREWNTNSKFCYVSHAVLAVLLATKGCDKLVRMAALREGVEGLVAYSERHFQRIDKLYQSAYVLEYFTGQMSLLPVADVQGLSKKRPIDSDDEDEDGDIAGRIFRPMDLAGVEADESEEDAPATKKAVSKKVANKGVKRKSSLGPKKSRS